MRDGGGRREATVEVIDRWITSMIRKSRDWPSQFSKIINK